MRNLYMGWGEISNASPRTVVLHTMLKLVLREKLFYCNEEIMLYLDSSQASGAGFQHSLSEWK